MSRYEFTNNWFDVNALATWDFLIPNLKPKKLLEIGSYEGRSTCYLIDKLSPDHDIEIHCIDTWEGGIDNAGTDMGAVEQRFDSNVSASISGAKNGVDFHKHKGFSDDELCQFMVSGRKSTFDFVYIDGSHQASDVLADAVLAFKLLRVGGVMAFDDYTWYELLPQGRDILRCPKMAIDAFTNINFRKIEIIKGVISQFYIAKISE